MNSQDNPSTQESFGFAVKAKEENTMKEKFKFTGEGGIVHTPLIHKEYMSEMISVDVSSPPISGTGQKYTCMCIMQVGFEAHTIYVILILCMKALKCISLAAT